MKRIKTPNSLPMSKPNVAMSQRELKLSSVQSLTELHNNKRILSGEFWGHVISRAIDDNDTVAMKIVADRLAPPKLVTDSDTKSAASKITINITGIGDSFPVGQDLGEVIDHEPD